MISAKRFVLRSPGPESRNVELFMAVPDVAEPVGAILFVHGNQAGQRIGAREMADDGGLCRFASTLGIVAAAVSQAGFGGSEGPPDFCGPASQGAIRAALNFLRSLPKVDPTRIVLQGMSRGAVASAVVATQEPGLRAIVLVAGVYDLAAAYRDAPPGIRRSIELEAGTSRRAFEERSAMKQAANIRAETLIIHGMSDERAQSSQAVAFAEAVKTGGASVSLHLIECGHDIPRDLRRAAVRPLYRRVFEPTKH